MLGGVSYSTTDLPSEVAGSLMVMGVVYAISAAVMKASKMQGGNVRYIALAISIIFWAFSVFGEALP